MRPDLIGRAKKKKNSFVLTSVHSEGSVGHGVSQVFCLVWGLFHICGLILQSLVSRSASALDIFVPDFSEEKAWHGMASHFRSGGPRSICKWGRIQRKE